MDGYWLGFFDLLCHSKWPQEFVNQDQFLIRRTVCLLFSSVKRKRGFVMALHILLTATCTEERRKCCTDTSPLTACQNIIHSRFGLLSEFPCRKMFIKMFCWRQSRNDVISGGEGLGLYKSKGIISRRGRGVWDYTINVIRWGKGMCHSNVECRVGGGWFGLLS